MAMLLTVALRQTATHYERLGTSPAADLAELRAAYRNRARQLHPDLGHLDGSSPMAELNEAWRVLSDEDRRRAYDATLPRPVSPNVGGNLTPAAPTRPPAPPRAFARREQWVFGIQLQLRRLTILSARSAVQTLLLRHPGGQRVHYDALVDTIVAQLLVDTEDRVRRARAGGAAPLDLAIGAALVGLHVVAEDLRTEAATTDRSRIAEMIDRMWDTLAHEVPRELEQSLGGNPRARRRLR